MTGVREQAVDLPHPALPGADWADAWEGVATPGFSDARAAAKAIIAGFPWWTWPLLALRTVLVLPFDLRGGKPAGDRVGFFPVVSERRDQLVGGIDDRHLDFRIVVDIEDTDSAQAVRLTTLITRHNRGGRLYLAAVLPFHRAIIKSALAQLAPARR